MADYGLLIGWSESDRSGQGGPTDRRKGSRRSTKSGTMSTESGTVSTEHGVGRAPGEVLSRDDPGRRVTRVNRGRSSSVIRPTKEKRIQTKRSRATEHRSPVCCVSVHRDTRVPTRTTGTSYLFLFKFKKPPSTFSLTPLYSNPS